MKDRMGRIIVWSCPLLVLICFLAVISFNRESQALESATSALLEDRLEDAFQTFDSLKSSFWRGGEATARLALTRILLGEPDGVLPAREHLADLPLRLFAIRALERGQWEVVLGLSGLLQQAGIPSRLYEVVALIELGRWDEARKLWAEVPKEDRTSWLGNRLNETMIGLQDPAEVPVRDRRGRLLGFLDPGRDQMRWAEESYAGLVPVRAFRDLPDGKFSGLGLTLDLDLSRLALEALGRESGTIVLLEPSSGRILAAVSDRRTLKRFETPAFEQALEPASVSKLLTTTAALRAGLDVDSDVSTMKCNGSVRFAGGVLYCPHPVGRLLGLDHAMAISCNVAFARLGVEVGREALLQEFRRFGFSSGPGALSRVRQAEGNDRQLADLSIGLEGTEITPLFGAVLAATFANHGEMVQPLEWRSTESLTGLRAGLIPARPRRRVVRGDWADRVLETMKAVSAPGGTAGGIAPPGFPVAMKTGTGAEAGWGYHVNYVGFGPLPSPEIAFSVRITGHRTSSRVRRAAWTVTSQLLAGLAKLSENGLLTTYEGSGEFPVLGDGLTGHLDASGE